MRQRRRPVVFRVVTAPAFAQCFCCRAALVGLRAWTWLEPGGRRGFGCRVHMFPAHAITAAQSAA